MELAELLPWIIAAVVIVVIVAVIVAVLRRRKRQERSDRLRSRYGPEYDRTVERADSRSDAEQELEERQERHDRMRLRDLDAEERRSLLARWEDLQASFVDGPASAVRGADVLLDDLARARGYPDAPADRRLDDLAVDHSDEVHAYRQASNGGTDVDDERRRLLAARGLFEAMLGTPADDEHEDAPPAPFDDHLTLDGREPDEGGTLDLRDDDEDRHVPATQRGAAAGPSEREVPADGPRSEQQPVDPEPRRSEA